MCNRNTYEKKRSTLVINDKCSLSAFMLGDKRVWWKGRGHCWMKEEWKVTRDNRILWNSKNTAFPSIRKVEQLYRLDDRVKRNRSSRIIENKKNLLYLNLWTFLIKFPIFNTQIFYLNLLGNKFKCFVQMWYFIKLLLLFPNIFRVLRNIFMREHSFIPFYQQLAIFQHRMLTFFDT